MVERSSMYLARFERAESIGDGIKILGERNFDEDEEEQKEIDEL